MGFVELDTELSETVLAVRDTARRFATEVLRPAGQALDKLTPEAVIAKDSILWDVYRQYGELGLNMDLDELDISTADKARLACIIDEELGWGDVGLSTSLAVAGYPYKMVQESGVPSLQEQFTADMIGCWAITEPDHGSDMLDILPEKTDVKPNCVARKEGNTFVISGQKSSWVSNGSIADYSALYCAVDMGSGIVGKAVFIVPLNDSAVSRGKPLDKLGQRALNQGEIFFDGLKVPEENMIISPEIYPIAGEMMLSYANSGVAANANGLARAALDAAVEYAKERIQGGVPIIEHQSVRSRLFTMFRKVESAKALNRNVVAYNMAQELPLVQYAMASKVTSTQTAFEVASEAVQIFGGSGITKEYPVEKMLRDARGTMIEDGCNYVLGMAAASRF